jgi:type IV pilus assembly protein PilM
MGLFGIGRKQPTFGLDIGSSSVKVVELVEARGGLSLATFATIPLPRDVIAEGTMKDPAVVSEAIKEAVDRAGIKSKLAVISISGREGITKRVPLPKV